MIFEDPRRRRWRLTLLVGGLLLAVGLGTAGLAVMGLFVPPELPDPFVGRHLITAAKLRQQLEQAKRPVFTKRQLQRMARIRRQERRRRERIVKGSTLHAAPLPSDAFVAFTIGDDAYAAASLEHHLGQIDVLVPDWFELPGSGCELTEHVDTRTVRIIGRSSVIVLPRLANVTANRWRGTQTGRFLRSDPARACLIGKLVGRLASLRVGGINIDLEELQPEDSEPLLEFLVELRAALHARSMRLTVDVAMHDPAYDLEYISTVADAVMIMAYDEHYPSSAPGPVASKSWFLDSLEEVLQRVPAGRAVVVLGGYGYDWTLGDKRSPAIALSFREAMEFARASGALPVFEEHLENSHFTYVGSDEATHDVWFQDAPALWNQYLRLRQLKLARVGLWRLGTEDATIWSFLGADAPATGPAALSTVPPGSTVDAYGGGIAMVVRAFPQPGQRNLTVERDGHIDSGAYARVPSGLLVERRGVHGKQLTITFDDGPDERWTPRVLDVLRTLRVPATFFVVGDQVTRFPQLVEREVAEGHLVGNHSFSHPHFELLTPREAFVEISSTQRLIEGLTHVGTPLFRAPYAGSIDPDDPLAFAPLREALRQGYLVLGADVDPQDWSRPGAQVIAARVVDQVLRGQGQVILLHDAGGDRSQTVEAIRRFVPTLRARGYTFVGAQQYLGVPRNAVAGPLDLTERLFSWGNAALAQTAAWGWVVLAWLFFICTALATVRILFLGSVTLWDLRRNKAPPPEGFAPWVTVLVPAFNEEKVIASTVEALLASDHGKLEVLVVNDGSTDRTAEVVQELAARDSRVRLLSQANAGKSAAANRGIAEARGEIIVAVDADTIVTPAAIPRLVHHFADPAVTAVCGNVAVGNVRGMLTAFQAIEYVTSQNFDRRAFAALNCISVVPGALGAWRRGAVLAVGGYSADTLTEDADLTLTILRAGGRVVYEAGAVGQTEAPERVLGLLRQRFRWTYGTYQCLWKHKRALFRGTLGWVGLPNMVLFQILFPALSPIGDLVMCWALIRGDWNAVLAGYVAFLGMDMCGSLLAFLLDRKPLRWLGLLLVQRFTYRQLMYYVSLRALLAALRGGRHGWRKIERLGTVTKESRPARDPAAGGSA